MDAVVRSIVRPVSRLVTRGSIAPAPPGPPAFSSFLWNQADAGPGMLASNGGFDVSRTTSGMSWVSIRGDVFKAAGIFQASYKILSQNNVNGFIIGFGRSYSPLGDGASSHGYPGMGLDSIGFRPLDGGYFSGFGGGFVGYTATVGDIVSLAQDTTNGLTFVKVNNSAWVQIAFLNTFTGSQAPMFGSYDSDNLIRTVDPVAESITLYPGASVWAP